MTIALANHPSPCPSGLLGGLGGHSAAPTPDAVIDRLSRQTLHRTSSALLAMHITATTTATVIDPAIPPVQVVKIFDWEMGGMW